jgi:hypothetical protein
MVINKWVRRNFTIKHISETDSCGYTPRLLSHSFQRFYNLHLKIWRNKKTKLHAELACLVLRTIKHSHLKTNSSTTNTSHSYHADKKTTSQKAEGTKQDHWRDFWVLETGTGQQVAQILDCYMMTKILLKQLVMFFLKIRHQYLLIDNTDTRKWNLAEIILNNNLL